MRDIKPDQLFVLAPHEEEFWQDIVRSSTMDYDIDYAVDAADKAVVALRKRKRIRGASWLAVVVGEACDVGE